MLATHNRVFELCTGRKTGNKVTYDNKGVLYTCKLTFRARESCEGRDIITLHNDIIPAIWTRAKWKFHLRKAFTISTKDSSLALLLNYHASDTFFSHYFILVREVLCIRADFFSFFHLKEGCACANFFLPERFWNRSFFSGSDTRSGTVLINNRKAFRSLHRLDCFSRWIIGLPGSETFCCSDDAFCTRVSFYDAASRRVEKMLALARD